MAGGDGSLINTLMKAKEFGVNITNLLCVSLPYGTGNDFCRVTGWGKLPDAPFYKSLKSLIKEICLNSKEDFVDVWDIVTKFQKGGDTLVVDNTTK
jgi:hypothetical protein